MIGITSISHGLPQDATLTVVKKKLPNILCHGLNGSESSCKIYQCNCDYFSKRSLESHTITNQFDI
jgi:hypothetical protein